jgi:hypothetical protein
MPFPLSLVALKQKVTDGMALTTPNLITQVLTLRNTEYFAQFL